MGGEGDEEQAEVKAKKSKNRKKTPKNKAREMENSLTNFWETWKYPGKMIQMSLNLSVTHHTTSTQQAQGASGLGVFCPGIVIKTTPWIGPSTAELQS